MGQTINQLVLDLNKDKVNLNEIVKVRQDDNNSHVIEASIIQNGQPYNLNGSKVQFEATKPDGLPVIDNASIKENNIITYTLSSNALSKAGKMKAYFKISDGTHTDTTSDFYIEVKNSTSIDAASYAYIKDVDDLIQVLTNKSDSYANKVQGQVDQFNKELNNFKADYQNVLNKNKNIDLSQYEPKSDADNTKNRVSMLENAGYVKIKQFDSDADAQNWSAQNHGIAWTNN